MKRRLSLTVVLGTLAFACGDSTPPALTPVPSASTSASVAPPVASPLPPATSSSAPITPPAPRPMAELQLETLKAAADAINAHDTAKYVALFTRTAIHKEAATRDLVGRDEIARRMKLLFGAFPDFKVSFDRVWQKGDVAIATWHWNGTDKGTGFMGKRDSGRAAGVQGVIVGFFNIDGLLREVHLYEDGQTVLSQLDASVKPGTYRLPPAAGGALAVTPAGSEEDANTKVVRELYDAIEAKKDPSAAFADDATVDDFAIPSKGGKGPAAWKALAKSWSGNFGAFTELPLYNVVAVGDTVVVERVLKGPVAPGAAVSLHVADVIQLKAGKIVSFGSYSNTLELTSQVGTKGLRRP